MMKFVTCAALLVAAFLAVEAQSPGHQFIMLPRLGHFKEQPFTDLYKHYAAAFVKPYYRDRANEDYRNYRPSGDECVLFLKSFITHSYKLDEMPEFIKLDACLGFLYETKDPEVEVEPMNQKDVETMKSDENLLALWQNTTINELGNYKSCVANMLAASVQGKKQFEDRRCNDKVLQVYLDFAECHKANEFPTEIGEVDSYLSMLYELLKHRADICFQEAKSEIEQNVRSFWKRKGIDRFLNKLKINNSLANQSNENKWPKPLIKLLAAVQNTTDEVNLREVSILIRGVYKEDKLLMNQLLNNIAQHAAKNIDLKKSGQDPYGTKRYRTLIDNMCSPFRAWDSDKDYDFVTPMIRLVQLLSHQDLFGYTEDRFIKNIFTKAEESAPIYAAIQVCNILTYTEGTINDMGNKPRSYTVKFVSDKSKMVHWPDSGYD